MHIEYFNWVVYRANIDRTVLSFSYVYTIKFVSTLTAFMTYVQVAHIKVI